MPAPSDRTWVSGSVVWSLMPPFMSVLCLTPSVPAMLRLQLMTSLFVPSETASIEATAVIVFAEGIVIVVDSTVENWSVSGTVLPLSSAADAVLNAAGPCPPSASAFSALVAVSALATDSPDASLLICLVAIFFAFFLVTGLALVVACSATAVPASAATSARTATMIAGDGRDPQCVPSQSFFPVGLVP